MTEIKLCGMMRPEDIEAVNELKPQYIGFVFAPKSRRYVTREQAEKMKQLLDPGIKAVGVFVNERPETVASLLNSGVIDMAQLHGSEDTAYIRKLRTLTDKPLIQAFRIRGTADLAAAEKSEADHILLDAGAGSGMVFNWDLLEHFSRPYFLAGGLSPDNVASAIEKLHPCAADVSSGIETDGKKDPEKMRFFVRAVRENGAAPAAFSV